MMVGLGRFKAHVKPSVWRRVLVPAGASLDTLHSVIRILFGWGTDHLHSFQVGQRRYSDPYFGLDDCEDQDTVRLVTALPREGATMTYIYDFGDWWEHMITLEKDPRAR